MINTTYQAISCIFIKTTQREINTKAKFFLQILKKQTADSLSIGRNETSDIRTKLAKRLLNKLSIPVNNVQK